MFDLESGEYFVSRDVIFAENEFPYLMEEPTTSSSTEWSPYIADGSELLSSENQVSSEPSNPTCGNDIEVTEVTCGNDNEVIADSSSTMHDKGGSNSIVDIDTSQLGRVSSSKTAIYSSSRFCYSHGT